MKKQNRYIPLKKFKSSSGSGRMYEVCLDKKESLERNVVRFSCNCPGFTRRKERTCKHVKSIYKSLSEDPNLIRDKWTWSFSRSFSLEDLLGVSLNDDGTIKRTVPDRSGLVTPESIDEIECGCGHIQIMKNLIQECDKCHRDLVAS